MTTSVQAKSIGQVTQVIGPVIDASFPAGKLPNIYNALVIKGKNQSGDEIAITCEVQQLLGDNCVRAVSMSATDGLMRGMDVIDTGSALAVPVGSCTLGRIFNVLGEPVDEMGPVKAEATSGIHRLAPKFVDLDTKLSIFETGIKVVDLLAPYRRGRSEEHTSELQSHSEISYAVFCLKKKKYRNNRSATINHNKKQTTKK